LSQVKVRSAESHLARAKAARVTPERLNLLVEHCFPPRRKATLLAHMQDVARFLGISPVTLRYYLRGERPIPRQVEIILEIFAAWPEVTPGAVDRLISARRRAES
jgi:hypothetical protein